VDGAREAIGEQNLWIGSDRCNEGVGHEAGEAGAVLVCLGIGRTAIRATRGLAPLRGGGKEGEAGKQSITHAEETSAIDTAFFPQYLGAP